MPIKRRTFFRNTTIAGGVLLIPDTILSFADNPKKHLVVIGNNKARYLRGFCEQNLISAFTSIGWNEEDFEDFSLKNYKHVVFDFYSIDTKQTQHK